MLNNKFIDDKNIINFVAGINREKVVKDGYYVVNICDYENVCNNNIYISSKNDKEEGKEFYIFGKMMGGVMTELLTGIVLKYIDDVDMIVDRKELSNKKYNYGYVDNFNFSNPCYMSAWQVYPKELVKILEDLDNNYDVIEYKDKILSQINDATNKYEDYTMDYEDAIDKFVYKYRTKKYTRI